MKYLDKIRGFVGKKTEFKPMSKFNLYFKTIQLIIYGVGLDMAFAKAYELDVLYFNGQITEAAAHGLSYAYYLGVGGVFMGLGFFRLLEIYWYIKDYNDVKEYSYSLTT